MTAQFYHNQLRLVYPNQFKSRNGLPRLDIQVLNNLNSSFLIPLSDNTTGYVCPYSFLIKSRFGSVEIRRLPTDLLFLERIRVISSMQNLGIGTKLMNHALASVDSVNCNVLVRVECYESSYELSRLLRFFNRFGFNIVASEAGYALMLRQNISQREQANG